MATPAKKGGLGVLLEMSGPGDGGDMMADKQAAVRDMFAAAKRGDWEGAAHAFQEAYDICAGGSNDEYSEDEDDEFLEE